MTYEELKNSLPPFILNDKAKFFDICKAVGVQVPIAERFYIKEYTPRYSYDGGNPGGIDFVVIPHPISKRELWVRKDDFAEFFEGLKKFKENNGL